jgi:glycosyltransferase involved in cell wall biosynthesis
MLKAALDSVLCQTYQDFEIIVIDDGSTDDTPTVVKAYGDRIRYVRQPNGGLGVARNRGLELATGEYVAFLDSDDVWFDFKLELQVALLRAMPAIGFLFTDFTVLHSDGRHTPRGSRKWLAQPDRDWSAIYPTRTTVGSLGVHVPPVPTDCAVYAGRLYREFLSEPLVLPTTTLARRAAIGSLRLTERMTIFDDWEFFAVLGRDHDAAFVDIDTAFNRSHDEPGRITRCSALSKAESYLEIVTRVWKGDRSFATAHGDLLRRVEGAALLAVAREALLASKHGVARNALAQWRAVGVREGRQRALAYSLLASLPAGRQLLRAGIISRKMLRSFITGGHAHHPVNPAA